MALLPLPPGNHLPAHALNTLDAGRIIHYNQCLMPVVAVYRPLDELTARALLAALESEGIRAELRQFHNPWEIPWLEGNPWGEILVLEEDVERARKVIEDFLANAGGDTASPNEDETASDE